MAGQQTLWNKGETVDELVHRFTVGDDPHWDRRLVHWDCLGSAAHVRTLQRAEVLTQPEADALIAELANIDALAREDGFLIPPELEDVHTAIEVHLTRVLGALGEKVHTGRSRNDQVATALRLFMRDVLLRWAAGIADFVAACVDRIRADGDAAMPGYTHLQPAMPSSVGQWLQACAEAALEQLRACLTTYHQLDACPLGTGAGFGVPLPLDRAFAAQLLGFARVQRSPIDVQNSRGRHERYVARLGADVGAVLEKLAWDLLLFSTAEFGFFELPAEMTTGSSIMPQKRNPDVLELLRARASRLRGGVYEIDAIAGKLPGSYHRDLQLTKAPLMRAAGDVADMLAIASRVVAGFEIRRERLAAAMRPELFATQAALDRVRQGTPFRQAYRQIAAQIAGGTFSADPRTAGAFGQGQAAPDDLQALTAELQDLRTQVNDRCSRGAASERLLQPGG